LEQFKIVHKTGHQHSNVASPQKSDKILWRILRVSGDILLNMSDTDLELLARYNRHKAEDAFAEIVRRHLDLVFSAALRQVRSPQLAEEVSQSTFISLARDANRLAPDTILAAWLYQVAHRTAANVVRREARRQLREQIASEMNAMNATAADWTHIEPLLDEAMHALDDTDRTAVLLRYFENKSLREVGATLGTSENAAQKRLSRAVESLREFFAKRGVTIGASGLVVVISANAVQAAPVGLVVTISTVAALAGTTIAATITATATKTIAMATLQKALIASIVLASVVTPLVLQFRAHARLRERDVLLQQGADQLTQLTAQHQPVSNLLARAKNPRTFSNDELSELLKLRGEVGRLRNRAQALTKIAAFREEDAQLSREQLWPARLNRLKRWLEENPSERIPELSFLPDHSWLGSIYPYKQETDDECRRSMSIVRANAVSEVMSRHLYPALRRYAENNGEQFPTDLSQLKSYLDSSVGDDVLERYTILPASNLVSELRPRGEWAISEKAPVNEAEDTRMAMGLTGTTHADRHVTNRWVLLR
jgi:RNA polymerase sigma factor (sigma-70 family)